MATIDFKGELFQPGLTITPAITKAAHIARTYGLGLIKARTPVDTSNLKASWKADLEGNGIRYTNSAYYAGFVENGTKRMQGRHMLADSLPDIENMFVAELGREIGRQLAADSVADNPQMPDYNNSVRGNDKFPDVGKGISPIAKDGLSKKKYTKKYLFPSPNDILKTDQKKAVNAARPRWQKYKRDFVEEYKVR